MTHKKRPSTEKMHDYEIEKEEFAEELGFNGANKTEVNCKYASQGESTLSKESRTRKSTSKRLKNSEDHR